MSLTIKHLEKKYPQGVTNTLVDINLEIDDGEFVCIVGPSGCGKSTLLNVVAGLEPASDGQVMLDGIPITAPGADRTVVFQEHGLFPWLNVLENVCFGMKLHNIPVKEQEEKANYYLELVHLSDYKEYAIHQLSGGMRQRTALARALTMDSKILLMDEPFASLDKQTSNRLREELERIWQETKRTILFITHSVEEAIYLADRIVILSSVKRGIQDIIPIKLPRPRDVYGRDFTTLRHRILSLIREEM